MQTISHIRTAAQNTEHYLAGEHEIGGQDQPMLEAARETVSRIKRYSDAAEHNTNWRHLERLATLAIGLLDQVHAITDHAARSVTEAQMSLRFIVDQAQAEAEALTAIAAAEPHSFPPNDGAMQ